MRELAQAANFAALTVNLPSGRAMTHVMWVDADDDHVLINTEVHRAKFARRRARPARDGDGLGHRRPVHLRGGARRVVETVRGPEAERTSTR